MIRDKIMSKESKINTKKKTKVDLKPKIHEELEYWAKRIKKSNN